MNNALFLLCFFFFLTAGQMSDPPLCVTSSFYLSLYRHASCMSHRDCFSMFTLNKKSGIFIHWFYNRILFGNHKIYSKSLVNSHSRIIKTTNFFSLGWDEACQYCPCVQLSTLYKKKGLYCFMFWIMAHSPIGRCVSGCCCLLVTCMKEAWLCFCSFSGDV